MMLTGALNLLRRVYGATAAGLRLVCVVANILMTIFAVLGGYVSRASATEFILVVGLMGGATVFSFVPAAQKRAKMNSYDMKSE